MCWSFFHSFLLDRSWPDPARGEGWREEGNKRKKERRGSFLGQEALCLESVDLAGAFDAHGPYSQSLRVFLLKLVKLAHLFLEQKQCFLLSPLQGATLHVKPALARVPSPVPPATPAWSCPTRARVLRSAPWDTTGMTGRPADVSASPPAPSPFHNAFTNVSLLVPVLTALAWERKVSSA